MAVSVNSNLASLGAQRRLGKATSVLEQAFRRLSSGRRIEKGADDAAGLSVAAALHLDSRVAVQGIRNLNDGISFLEIAEGAMASLTDIVQRITELAEQAANGVLSPDQRLPLDAEADELVREFNRIRQSTSFNGRLIFDDDFGALSLQESYGIQGSLTVELALSETTTSPAGTYSTRLDIASGVTSDAPSIVDVNNDGILDILNTSSGSSSPGAINVFLGQGDGTFGPLIHSLASPSSFPNVIADFNEDGFVDVAVALTGSGNLNIHFGAGDGTFGAGQSVGAGGGSVYSIAAADVNHDNNVDIVTVTMTDDEANVLLGNGNGTFQAPLNYPTDASNPRAVALADLNGDTHLDIITADSGGDILTVRLGIGNGTFGSRNGFATGNLLDDDGGPPDLAIADLNGDGDLDVAVTGGSDGMVHIHFGDGSGNLGGPTSIPAGNIPVGVEAADLNGDGLIDLVSAARGGDEIYISYNSGGGSFQAPTVIATGQEPFLLTIGDLNGDGAPDILVGAQLDDELNLFFQDVTTTTRTVDFVRALDPVDLTTQGAALSTLDSTRERLNELNLNRGTIGSFRSRIDVAISRQRIAVESFRAAESAIVDADIAAEAATLTSAAILQGAGAAVLAQANEAPALSLRLLGV